MTVSREGFIRRRNSEKIAARWDTVLVILPLLAIMTGAVLVPLDKIIGSAMELAALVGIVIAFGFLSAWRTRRRLSRYEMACPFCGGSLVGLPSQIVVASGNCGNCGERILE